MRYHARSLLLAAAVLAASTAAAVAAEADPQVTSATLIREMIDLGRLGELPDPPYKTVQFSSHDRRSNLPNGRDWFANADGFGGEPIPGVEAVLKPADASKVGTYLLAEIKGPGALVRTWTASEDGKYTGMNGTIRMYLDGSPKPIFDGPAQEFLRGLYPTIAKQHAEVTTAEAARQAKSDGASPGLVGPLLEFGKERNTNPLLTSIFTLRDAGYYPVPFAKGCRVEWTGRLDEVHFYHIEFRKYREGTRVRTFEPRDLLQRDASIGETAFYFAFGEKPFVIGSRRARDQIFAFDTQLEPEKYHELLHVQNRGGRIVEFKIKATAKDMNRALRQTVLTMFFDHFSRPQVESPLGDFFAAAPGINPYKTLPVQVDPDGTMTCRFVMPFKERAHLWIINHSPAPVKLTGRAVVDDHRWDDARTMHFYAQWRVNHEMQVSGRRGFDIPFIMAQGQGRFVGCSVHIMNPDSIPTGNWWGEGDEKIFVDDDRLPSFFGTGSEDYFNYSWSVPDLFSYAYFAQPRCDGPFTRGFITNNRFHVLDDIPFERRLNFFLEMIHHNVVDGLSYARISYYYGRPGIYSDHTPIFREDIRPPPAPENWEPKAAGRQQKALYVQMEDMKGAEKLVETGTFWARGKRIAWRPRQEGQTLPLSFNLPKGGKYHFVLVMGLSPDSGRFAVQLNGKTLSARDGHEWLIDLYTPFHTMARHYEAEQPIDFPQGENKLTVIYRGRNEASQGTLIGGDFLWVQP